jgi:hypothetical protein
MEPVDREIIPSRRKKSTDAFPFYKPDQRGVRQVPWYGPHTAAQAREYCANRPSPARVAEPRLAMIISRTVS